jgi:hypothetical protein
VTIVCRPRGDIRLLAARLTRERERERERDREKELGRERQSQAEASWKLSQTQETKWERIISIEEFCR